MVRLELAEPPGLLESRWRGLAGVALLGAYACGGTAKPDDVVLSYREDNSPEIMRAHFRSYSSPNLDLR